MENNWLFELASIDEKEKGEYKYPEIKNSDWKPKGNEQLMAEANGNLWWLCELARTEERRRLTEEYIQNRLYAIAVKKMKAKTKIGARMLYAAQKELQDMGLFLFGGKRKIKLTHQ